MSMAVACVVCMSYPSVGSGCALSRCMPEACRRPAAGGHPACTLASHILAHYLILQLSLYECAGYVGWSSLQRTVVCSCSPLQPDWPVPHLLSRMPCPSVQAGAGS